MALTILGVLRSGEWGWVAPKPGAPQVLGISPVFWLLISGIGLLYLFLRWAERLEGRGSEPLVRPSMFRNHQISASLTPRLLPKARPRLVVRLGFLGMLAGSLFFVAGLDPEAGAEIVAIPMLLLGLGIGALASQLGAVTVSAVPDKESAEVGGLQNTVTSFGASLGTALVGSVLIASLSGAFVTNVLNNPAVPQSVKSQIEAATEGGAVPFVSDTQLTAEMEKAGVPPNVSNELVNAYSDSRLTALATAMSLVVLSALMGLFFTSMIPIVPVGSDTPAHQAGDPRAAPTPA
jgi:hypothetical protein